MEEGFTEKIKETNHIHFTTHCGKLKKKIKDIGITLTIIPNPVKSN